MDLIPKSVKFLFITVFGSLITPCGETSFFLNIDIMKDLKLGDKVETLIENTIPKSLIDMIKKNGCDCEGRKDWLNNLTRK